MLKINHALSQKFGSNFHYRAPLKQLIPSCLGGIAQWVVIVNSSSQVIDILNIIKDYKIPYLYLSGGRHGVLSDNGYPSLVIINKSNLINPLFSTGQIMADGSVSIEQIIAHAASNDLGGLELFQGQFSSLGSLIDRNIRLNGVNFTSHIRKLNLAYIDCGEVVMKQFSYDWLGSGGLAILKQKSSISKPIILNATIQFQHQQKNKIISNFPPIQNSKLGLHGSELMIGPIFEDVSSDYRNVKTNSVESMHHPVYNLQKLFADTGANKLKFINMKLSQQYINYIIYSKGTSSNDIRKMIEAISAHIYDRSGVKLRCLIEWLGMW